MTKNGYHGTAVLYALPFAGVALILGPIGLMGGIYSRYYGLSLTTIALILTIGRVFDAITDPLIGVSSDWMKRRMGTRKPLIVVGAVIFMVAAWFLFVPPDREVGTSYFIFWIMAFYLGSTIVYVPGMAWAGDATSSESARSFMFTMYYALSSVGGIVFYIIPLLPLFETSNITPEVLRVVILAGICVLLPTLMIAVKYVPSDTMSENSACKSSTGFKGQSLKNYFLAYWQNKPFLSFVMVTMCFGLGFGSWLGLFFVQVDLYIGLGDQYTYAALMGAIISIPAAFTGRSLVLRMSWQNAWVISCLPAIAGFILSGVLTPEWASFWVIVFVHCLCSFTMAAFLNIALIVLSGVADYGALKSGVASNAGYFALYYFFNKLQVALGSGLALAIVGLGGFDPQRGVEQTRMGILSIQICVSVIPIIFVVLAIYLAMQFPIGSRKHQVICKALKRQNAGVGNY